MTERDIPPPSQESEQFLATSANDLVTYDDVLLAARLLPHGTPETYGATPLDKVSTHTQQMDLFFQFQKLTAESAPEGTPAALAEFINGIFAARFHGRADANWHNYMTSLKKEDKYENEPIVMQSIERAKAGHATPAELLLVRQLLGIRSIELAALTHPYGEGIGEPDDKLGEMRDAVERSIDFLKGTYDKNPKEHFRVKEIIFDKEGVPQGLLITRKKVLATLNDHTIVKERSSFVLRIDPASQAYMTGQITKRHLALMGAVNKKSKHWGDIVAEVGGIQKVVTELLAANIFSEAIPISTTIYAHHPKTAEQILKNEEDKKLKERNEVYAASPALAAAMAMRRAMGPPVGDDGGDE